MKKNIAILRSLKLLMIAFLLVACGKAVSTEQDKVADPQQPSTGETQTIEEPKINGIAYINIDSIIRNYDYYYDLRREFEQKAQKKEKEFKVKVDALKADVQSFVDKNEKMLMSRSEAEEQKMRLEQRESDLNEEYGKVMEILRDEEAVTNRKVIDAIQTYVEKYNVDKKYSLILNAATIIVGSSSMDITAEILRGLNQEYIASRTK
jgi:outer membrane protein